MHALVANSSVRTTPRLLHRSSVLLVPAAPSLWRVVDPSGRIIGHLQAVLEGDGVRYRARRFQPGGNAFFDLGAFWSADDAVDTLRYSR